MTFGTQIQIWRAEKKWTQEDLGKFANLSKVTIGQIETNDDYKPTLKTIVSLAKVFDKDVEDIIIKYFKE